MSRPNEKDFLNLQGKRIVVTGASAGIGEAIALEFARQGCHLMLCGRDQVRLAGVALKCRQVAPIIIKVSTTTGDLTNPKAQQAVVDNTERELGGMDVLVNNAGVLTRADYKTSEAEYQRVMSTNLDSLFFLTQRAVPHLSKTKGNIVNISSIVSESPSPNVMVYSISKGALDTFTKALALNVASKGIRVNSVNPGSVVSLLYRRGEEDLGDEAYAKFVRSMSDSSVHPLGRMGLASEVADSVVFLASERASFITGQIVFVDGGRHCVGPTPRL